MQNAYSEVSFALGWERPDAPGTRSGRDSWAKNRLTVLENSLFYEISNADYQ